MKAKVSALILFVALTASISPLGSTGRPAQDKEAKQGDSAVGMVVKEKRRNGREDALWLLINPCSPERAMLFFRKPYVIETTYMECKGRKLAKVTKQ
jgi:hypothetical protein